MLSIRFSRIGKNKEAHFRLLVCEKQKDPWGKHLEILGNYFPKTKQVALKADRIKYWLSVGAKCTNTVNNFLIKQGIIEGGKKMKVVKISKRRAEKINKVKEDAAKKLAEAKQKEAEAKAAAEAPKEEVKEEASETPAEIKG